MSRRRRPEPGDYLVIDDITGRVKPRSEVQESSDGLLTEIVEYNYVDHPQLFVRPLTDPEPVPDARPRQDSAAPCPVRYLRLGDGSLRDQWHGPASQGLVESYSVIGVASIGCTFQVHP